MSTPLTSAKLPSLDSTLGALFLGEIFAAILFGVTTLQTYIYFDNYKDGRTLRTLVGLLWVLDALHLAFSVHGFYWYGVTNFMHPEMLAIITWSLRAALCLTAASDGVVRSIFLSRTWIISNKSSWIKLIAAVTSGLMLLNIAMVAVVVVHDTTEVELDKFKWVGGTIFGSSMLADLIITATLCYLLWSRRAPPMRQTNSLLRVLMLYSINTGALTCSCNIITLITYIVMPDNFVYTLFYLSMPKLYLNSLLAMLNARAKLRENGSDIISLHPAQLEDGSQPYIDGSQTDKMNGSRSILNPVQVQVNTTITTDASPQFHTIAQ